MSPAARFSQSRASRLRAALLACLLPVSIQPSRAAAPPAVGGDHAMVVTAHELATRVGLDILRQGGNVVDAAVAIGYALAVVYPAAGNLGGGGFMTIRMADGRTTFLDFREKAPLAATRTMFLDGAGQVVAGRSTDSWLAVGVPGSVAGLEAARERYGSLSRAVLIAPAEALAQDGYVVGQGDAVLFRLAQQSLLRDEAARAVFEPNGEAPRPGDIFRQPELARSLGLIARDGASAFYQGPVGEALVAASRAGGGLLSMEDLSRYAVREMAPITCTYRGYTIRSAPPPSSGGVAICETLNILEGFDLKRLGFHGAAEVHALSEAMRLAFHDRNDALGDPAFIDNPVTHLIDKGYAARLRAAIPVEGPANVPLSSSGVERPQTTHYSVADAAGNAVAVTTTLNGWFGAGRVAAGTGILVNNEMDDFTTKPGAPNMFGLVQGEANAIQPGKTPLSSMAPTIVERDGRLVLVIGSPGGSRIITTVVQTIVNLVDHAMTLPEAVDAPRIHMQGEPDKLFVEPFALSPDTRTMLEAQGYTIAENATWGMAAGILAGAPSLAPRPEGGHALSLDGAATPFALYGAADVRSLTGNAEGF